MSQEIDLRISGELILVSVAKTIQWAKKILNLQCHRQKNNPQFLQNTILYRYPALETHRGIFIFMKKSCSSNNVGLS